MCAQARRRFTQVIHMVVHSKACKTFSCQAGRQQRSACRCLREGPRDRTGRGLDDIAPEGGHRMLAARPAGQAARVPGRLPAVTLTVIPPAARPRYAQAARAQSPPALAPRLRDHDHEPEREAPVPIDDRVQQLVTGRQRPMPGRWPPEASLLATARHPVLRARTPAVLHGSVAGAAAPALTASGPARPPGDLARARPDPQIIAAGIPAVAGVPALARRSCRAESGKAPPCMRWRGRARPRRARPASCLVFAGAARRPPGPGTRARDRSPGSSRVPGVAPGWCPFPAVKAFLLPPRAPRKALRPAISCFPLSTKESTESRQLSAFHGGYPRVYSQPARSATGCKPENT